MTANMDSGHIFIPRVLIGGTGRLEAGTIGVNLAAGRVGISALCY
jgi:hypothetical protein